LRCSSSISSSRAITIWLDRIIQTFEDPCAWENFVLERDLTYEDLKDRLRKAEESLRRNEKLAIAGRYAGAVMHEVNNPLEAITNLVYLTKSEAHDAESVRRNMRVVEAQLVRLGEITRQTLSFYREEAGAKDFDLVEIAESALRIHSHRFCAKSIAVRKELPQRLVARVFAGEILQVFSNLILNALDALPDNDGILCLRLRKFNEHVHILIADNGHGIHPSLHKGPFEPYVTNKKEGTGVGLWLSKRIIENHRGTIRFRSSLLSGKSGTVFLLTLPVEEARSHASNI
jgi:signal transduction histidine kinase